MSQDNIAILAIETSCDETAAAVATATLKGLKSRKRPNRSSIFQFLNSRLLSNIVASQIDIHAATGGVVPEVAARAHVEAIIPTIEQALQAASAWLFHRRLGDINSKERLGCLMQSIDAIAVTTGPGLIGALLIGVETAKTLAYVFQKPIIPINHLEGHIYANFVGETPKSKPQKPKKFHLSNDQLQSEVHFPALVLIVSGGHTELVLMNDHLSYELVGQTRDDAAGECFDKTARLLGLPYPGGPALSQLAENGDPTSFDFPRPMLASNNFDFSFSGLKTAVYYTIHTLTHKGSNPEQSNKTRWGKGELTPALRADLAASIQAAIIDVLVAKTLAAAIQYDVKTVMISGGVAANRCLRARMEQAVKENLPTVIYRQPNLALATDNAGMIAIAGIYRYLNGDLKNWYDVRVDANASLT